jgi:soluble lytic murein transglycosylase
VRRYVDFARRDVQKAYPIFNKKYPQQLEALTNYHAEAYHLIAQRVAPELKDIEGAYQAAVDGLKIANLNSEWQGRLHWYAGLFRYIAGDIPGAISHWLDQEKINPHAYLEPQIWFWLAKSYNAIGSSVQSQFYLQKLTTSYPLSFYSVVALKMIKEGDSFPWTGGFQDLQKIAKNLDSFNLSIKELYDHKEIGPQLRRVEILLRAQVKPWSDLALKNLENLLTKHVPLTQNPDAYVYLSRLYFAADNFIKSISLTTAIAREVKDFWQRWPEQIFVNFPTPYQSSFIQKAKDSLMDYRILYAISRQESAFNPQARSSANALGLMQLILPTARPYAADYKLDDRELSKRLLEPDFSIAIGSLYLKNLDQIYRSHHPAIFAAYNAGETATNAWLQNRNLSDNSLIWIELIPFGETRDYVKNVWRNLDVYHHLSKFRDAEKN